MGDWVDLLFRQIVDDPQALADYHAEAGRQHLEANREQMRQAEARRLREGAEHRAVREGKSIVDILWPGGKT